MKGYEIPEFARTSKGLPIINLLPLEKEEFINSIISIEKDTDKEYLFFATKKGIVKKTNINEFENIRTSGKICISLKDNDELIGVKLTSKNDLILLGSSTGKLVKFQENEIRAMGRTAAGVKGINLDGGNCICLEVVNEDNTILVVTELGYGKKTLVSQYRQTKRGSKGVKALNTTEKNGMLVSVKLSDENKDLILMTNIGTTIKIPISQISKLGRNTQGTRLIHLKDNQKVTTISIVDKNEMFEVVEK